MDTPLRYMSHGADLPNLIEDARCYGPEKLSDQLRSAVERERYFDNTECDVFSDDNDTPSRT